jgi:hypothetical protein
MREAVLPGSQSSSCKTLQSHSCTVQAAQTGFSSANGGAGAGDNGFSPVQNAVANVLKEGGPVADGLSLQEV